VADLAEVLTARGPTELVVDADLQVVLTTAPGESTLTTVTARGQQVRVDTQRPDLVVAAMDRADVGRVAELFAATGIAMEVHGPHGPVAVLGAGTSNRWGRAITGSRRVAPAPRAVLRIVWARRSARAVVVAVPGVLLALAAIGRLRRTTARPGCAA
jgi:hypothetical protein